MTLSNAWNDRITKEKRLPQMSISYCLLKFVLSFRVLNAFSSYNKYQILSCSLDATCVLLSCCKVSTGNESPTHWEKLRSSWVIVSAFMYQTPYALRIHSHLWPGKKYLSIYMLPCLQSKLGQLTGFTLFQQLTILSRSCKAPEPYCKRTESLFTHSVWLWATAIFLPFP